MPIPSGGGAPESARPLTSLARCSPRGRRRRAFALAGIVVVVVGATTLGLSGAAERTVRTVWADLGSAYSVLR